ncbi:MAG TPA: preprotein translocase subunit SecE [Proteobacteria bacterium]|nr:preprotein translocase subunit SecE [Pseudomonadota bacterium]
MFNKIRQFLKEVNLELKKVTWPSRKDTIASTWVVLLVILIFAAYFFVVDGIIAFLVKSVLGF